MGEKKCTCRCHTWGETCAGFGPFDNSCCEQPHVMWEEWKTRIDGIKKKKLMVLFQEQSKKVGSEGEINSWISEMDIPEHIKKVLHKELWFIGCHYANFGDQCEFDVRDNIRWVNEVLEKFL